MPGYPNSRVVILSTPRDAHLPYVTQHLTRDPLILDPQLFLKGHTLTYASIPDEHSFAVLYDGEPVQNVSGVWFRKPSWISAGQVPVDSAYQAYAQSALNWHATYLLTAFPRARWLSDPFAISKADNKTWQLAVASKLGFTVPKTLITSDQKAAHAFLQQQKEVIVKPQATTFPVVNGVPQAFYATRISSHKPPDFSRLHLAPAFFQQAIPTVSDVRVVVVGNRMFAAAIQPKKQTLDPVRDWRKLYFSNNATIATHDLPDQVQTKCIKLVKELGLSFGAIDLVVDESGDYWFLENNANGQWAFIEEVTKQPIGAAIANFLQQRS